MRARIWPPSTAGERVRFESLVMHRDGGPRLVQATYVPDQAHKGFFALVIDVTSDRHREQALRDAEHAARAANELKDQFLATLSHELRTPLNVILGYAQMSQAGAVAPEHAIEVIERNAQLQARLVEDLLDVSRIASGKFQFATDRVPVAPVVADAVAMLRPSATAKAIRVEVGVEDPALAVLGDPARCVSCSPTSCTMRSSSRAGTDTSPSPPGARTGTSCSRCATAESASRRIFCLSCSTSSDRPTAARRASTAVLVWVWPSRRGSSKRMVDG